MDQEQVLALVNTLLSNPETRAETLKLVKKVYPNFQAPELMVDEKYKALQEELEKLRREREEEKLMQERAEKLKKAQEKGFNPEELENVMVQKGIADYDTAMEFLEAQKKAATPYPKYEAPLQEIDLKSLAQTNVNDWARKEALKVLQEERG